TGQGRFPSASTPSRRATMCPTLLWVTRAGARAGTPRVRAGHVHPFTQGLLTITGGARPCVPSVPRFRFAAPDRRSVYLYGGYLYGGHGSLTCKRIASGRT